MTTAVATAVAASVDAKPFLKWVGGKRQLLPVIALLVPPKFGTYYEPFLGGGALFFALRPKRAWLTDANERLVRAYRGVRDGHESVARALRLYPHSLDFFQGMRELKIDNMEDGDVAAWLIYLNKTCFNGLYRVNKANRFNVPFGRYTNPKICDAENLLACSAALSNAHLECGDFEAVVNGAKRGDFVYFDPPYVPISVTSDFTSYTKGGFDVADQIRLRDVARGLKKRGVHVLLSNSSAPIVRELYGKGFEIIEVSATRRVNSKASARGAVTELLIR